MSTRLSQQLQELIDTLTFVRLRAVRAAQTSRRQDNLILSLRLRQADTEVAHLISTLRDTKLLAAQCEAAEAQSQTDGAPSAQPQLDGA